MILYKCELVKTYIFKGFATFRLERGWKVMSDIFKIILFLILIIVDKTIVIIEKIKKPSADNTRQK